MSLGVSADLKIPDAWYDFYARFLPGSLFAGASYVLWSPAPHVPSGWSLAVLAFVGYCVALLLQPVSSAFVHVIEEAIGRCLANDPDFVHKQKRHDDEAILGKMHAETMFHTQCAGLVLIALLMRQVLGCPEGSAMAKSPPERVLLFAALFLAAAVLKAVQQLERARRLNRLEPPCPSAADSTPPAPPGPTAVPVVPGPPVASTAAAAQAPEVNTVHDDSRLRLLESLKTEIAKAAQFRLHEDVIRFGLPLTWLTVLLVVVATREPNWTLLVAVGLLTVPVIVVTRLEHMFYIRYRGWQYVLEYFAEQLSGPHDSSWLSASAVAQCRSLKGVTDYVARLAETLPCDPDNSDAAKRIMLLHDMIQLRKHGHATSYAVLLIVGLVSAGALCKGLIVVAGPLLACVAAFLYALAILRFIDDTRPPWARFVNPLGG